GPHAARPTRAGPEREAEKASSGPPGITLPRFLPYFDDVTGEPQNARLAYRRMWADPNVKAGVSGLIFEVGQLPLKVQPASKTPFDRHVAEFVEWSLTRRL